MGTALTIPASATRETRTLICKWKTLALHAAQGTSEKQFYLTLASSLVVSAMLIPPKGETSSGYVRSAESQHTDIVEGRVLRDLQELAPNERSGALKQFVRTLLQEAGLLP